MDMITEKQFNYIKSKLGHEIKDIKQLKKLTKKEASGIIKRNIVEHRPFLQWYVWQKEGKIYTCTTRGYTMDNKLLGWYERFGILITPIIFINKRLADEYVGEKTIKRSIISVQAGIYNL